MSYIDYTWAQAQIGGWRRDDLSSTLAACTKGDPPFYGVIMLAMLRADTDNLAHLTAAWPQVQEELGARYEAPGGILASDPEPLKHRVAASLGTTVAALEANRDAPAADHSASRSADVLAQEAPHLLAPSSPIESEAHDA